MRPHRQQPTRLHCPWDSPGKKTGVGCHFLPQCVKVKSESEVAQSYRTLSDPMDCSLPGSSVHGVFQARVLEWGAIAFSESSFYLRLNNWVLMYHLYGMTVTHHPAALAFYHASSYSSRIREQPCPSVSFFLTLFLSDMGHLIAYRLTFSKSHSENWRYVFYWLSYSYLEKVVISRY